MSYSTTVKHLSFTYENNNIHCNELQELDKLYWRAMTEPISPSTPVRVLINTFRIPGDWGRSTMLTLPRKRLRAPPATIWNLP